MNIHPECLECGCQQKEYKGYPCRADCEKLNNGMVKRYCMTGNHLEVADYGGFVDYADYERAIEALVELRDRMHLIDSLIINRAKKRWHSTEDDFQHFLSYTSGVTDPISRLRMAYLANSALTGARKGDGNG